MRPIVIGLFAAIMAAVLCPAAGAFAADAPKPAAAAPVVVPKTVDPASRVKGKAAAPGVITAAKLDCDLADARFMGQNTDPKTKAVSTFYEIACKNSEGFVIAVHPAPAEPEVFTCLEVMGTAATCILPTDLDPKAGLAPLVLKTDPDCVVDRARGIGHAADGSKTVFEVGCHDGSAFALETSFPMSPNKPAKMVPCIVYDLTSNAKCSLTDAAGEAAYVDRLAAQAVKDCVAKDRRFIGSTNAGELVYEVACQNGKGYEMIQLPNLQVSKAIDCADTDQCTLTDTRAAKNEQNALYTKLARAGGFACDVEEYGPLPVTMPGHEVVELKCHNRPDGAIAIFPASSAEPAVFYDCGHSELEGYRCAFTKPEAAVVSLTDDLKKLGKNTCVVSAARIVGLTADKHGYIEVACADGGPGYTVEYTVTPLAAMQAFPCTGPPPVNGTCILPGNKKK